LRTPSGCGYIRRLVKIGPAKDKGKSHMSAKRKITTAELAELIMKEIRQHPECSHVMSVGFTKPPQQSPHHPNWAPAWTTDGPKLAPAIAFEIGQRFQNEFDLV
jgi:hypothetical protein